MLDDNPRQVLPDAPDLAAEGKDLEKAVQHQIDGFKQLNTLLSKLLKDVNPVSGCLQSDINTVQGPCTDFLKYGMTNTPGFCDADALKGRVDRVNELGNVIAHWRADHLSLKTLLFKELTDKPLWSEIRTALGKMIGLSPR